jgi:metallo-beta-lactamase family protein
MGVTVKFCGAAGTVTGSCYWVRAGQRQFLVDCGMFQGPKSLKALNYDPFPFDPAEIEFVLLTHAHIDHAGLVPKLIRNGFTGTVHATAGTRDLLSWMLPDSGYIQESEVRRLNRRNAQRGLDPVEPIYTREDGARALECFRRVDYERWTVVGDGVRVRYWNAGHLLGSASIEIELADGPLRLLFSGDIGPEHKLFHPDPDGPSDLDVVVCESTYGGRVRPAVTPEQRRALFAAEVNEALAAGGVLLIPSFAVERTQELLADLTLLIEQGHIARVPVFLDSPLAIRATEVFIEHAAQLEDTAGRPDLFRMPNIHFTETSEESMAIGRYDAGVIVLAASGMCEAGRIRHHLKRYLWQRRSTVLLVGYQARGTLGALLLEGKQAVRIMGEDVRVRARIRSIDLYSGHADGAALIAWIRERLPIRRALYLTHGEPESLTALREGLVAAGCEAGRIAVPSLDDEYDLLGKACVPLPDAAAGVAARRVRRLAPEAVGRLDWHNDLAQFSLDLRARLDAAADEKAREGVLRRVRRALDPADEPDPDLAKPAPRRRRQAR